MLLQAIINVIVAKVATLIHHSHLRVLLAMVAA